MFEALKFRSTEESRVFFWSDIHDSHEKEFILNPRGFKTASEGKEIVKQRWLKKITNKDVVFLLGDLIVGAGRDGEKRFWEMVKELPFKELYLLPGNHYSGYRQAFLRAKGEGDWVVSEGLTAFSYTFEENIPQKVVRLNLEERKTIHFVPNYFEIYVNGRPIVLSHYPILSWNGMGKGSWHIHGHCHGSLYNSEIGKMYYKNRVIDVGIECCPEPLSFEEVKVIMENKTPIAVDHHNEETSTPFC
jgi:calcineurin-like phosphoesterase family protein